MKNKRANKKQKVTRPVYYTENERNSKMTAILFQMMQMNIDHLLTNDLRKHIDEYIKNGTEYRDTIDLPEFSRVMEINFSNDKNEETYIRLAFKKVRIEDEGDENPINKLNKLQEQLM